MVGKRFYPSKSGGPFVSVRLGYKAEPIGFLIKMLTPELKEKLMSHGSNMISTMEGEVVMGVYQDFTLFISPEIDAVIGFFLIN